MFSLYALIFKLLVLGLGLLLMYTAYKDWSWLYFLPFLSDIRKKFGKQAARSAIFLSGLVFDIFAVWLIF